MDQIVSSIALLAGVALGAAILLVIAVRFFLNRAEFQFPRLGFAGIGMILVALPVLATMKFEISPEGFQAEFSTIDRQLQAVGQGLAEVVARIDTTTLDLLGRELREPSGITAADIAGPDHYAVAVDDENEGVFIIEGLPEGTVVHGPIGLRYDNVSGKDPNDLEAVCFDGSSYYATTSHRRIGGDHARERRLIRFEIGAQWRELKYEIAVDRSDVRDLSALLAESLTRTGVRFDLDAWAEKLERSRFERHPYALEVEGLACSLGRLLVGLRWPLHEGKAIVFQYDWSGDALVGDPKFLDLEGKGISSMEFDSTRRRLLVVANPPEKVWPDDSIGAVERFLGSSELYVFSLDSSGLPNDLVSRRTDVARHRAKLEGAAIVGDELWLAYDGQRPAIVRRSIHSGLLD